MIYEFKHSETGLIIERSYSMKGPIPEKVEHEGSVYERVYSIPGIIMDVTKCKTIGSLAEKNTELMVKRGDAKVDTKPPDTPFWRKGKKINQKLAGLSPKAKARYVREGKL